MAKGLFIDNVSRTAILVAQLDALRSVLRSEHPKSHRNPWIFAFSGDEDAS